MSTYFVNNTDHFERWFKDNPGMSMKALGDIIGCSGSSIGQWRAKKQSPLWSQLAIEALERRQGGRKDVICICIVRKDKLDHLGEYVKFLGGQISHI